MKFLVAACLLVAAACSGESTISTASTTSVPATSAAATTTTAPPSTEAPTSTAATTTTVAPVTTVPPPEGATAAFAITQVQFGDGAFIQLTNIGTASGDPGGHWLCQRPLYYEVPSVELGPGQSVWIAADSTDLQSVGDVAAVFDAEGGLGDIGTDTGEVAFYLTRDFGNQSAIVDYVEWGEPGHGRSSVAVNAGIWPLEAS